MSYHRSVDTIPIDDFISKIVTKIRNHTHPNVTNWLFPNFSTTTPQDSAVAGAAIMATMKSYFKYNMFAIACGIPAITVKGSGKDWRQIRDKISLLPAFSRENDTHIGAWSHDLVKVIDQFITVTETKIVDSPFWEGIVKHGSRPECGGTTYINGWITLFSVFDSDGRWQVESWRAENFQNSRDSCLANDTLKNNYANLWPTLELSQLTPGVVRVPIEVHDEYGGDVKKYNAALFAGHVGHAVASDGVTLQPLVGWGFEVVGRVPKYLKEFSGAERIRKGYLEVHVEQDAIADEAFNKGRKYLEYKSSNAAGMSDHILTLLLSTSIYFSRYLIEIGQ